MAPIIPFTDNIDDLSNERGYQFEFHCERCGNGYRSPFQEDLKAKGVGILRAAGGLLGGSLGNAAWAADSLLDRGTNSKAKDEALEKAMQAVQGNFTQCRACGDWVCNEVCWNREIGQCVKCSPFIEDEIARAQSHAHVEQIIWRTNQKHWTKDDDLGTKRQVTCEQCGAALDGAKFCPECGSPASAKKHCTNCGSEMKPSANFCGDCGTKFD